MPNKTYTRTAKTAPYPPCTMTASWLKKTGHGRCLHRVTQPPHIAGPLGLITTIKHMRTTALIILILISFSNDLYSQKTKNPIDYRFKNGKNGFSTFFYQTIDYPLTAMENGIVGNCFIKTTIKPTGEISDISIINPVDSTIDNEVMRVIKLSQKLWKKCDTIDHDQIFYIQVAFSFFFVQPNTFAPKSQELAKLFLEPIIVTIVKKGETKKPILKDDELAAKANLYLSANKYPEALPLVNELIKRDPFNIQLYKIRIEINKYMNNLGLAESESLRLNNFIDGYSLDDLLKN